PVFLDNPAGADCPGHLYYRHLGHSPEQAHRPAEARHGPRHLRFDHGYSGHGLRARGAARHDASPVKTVIHAGHLEPDMPKLNELDTRAALSTCGAQKQFPISLSVISSTERTAARVFSLPDRSSSLK